MENIRDYKTIRHGRVPITISHNTRLFTSEDSSYTVERIFCDDNRFCIRVFRINNDTKTIYVDYMSFSDIISMFSCVDLLTNHYRD